MADEELEQTAPDESVTSTDPGSASPVESTADVVADVTTTETGGATAVPAEPQMRGLFDVLRERQFAVDHYKSEQEALDDIVRRAQQRDALEARAREVEWHYQQLAQQRQAQAAEPAKPAEKKEWWKKPPDWNPEYESQLKLDENGNIVARPGAQPDLPQKRAAYNRYVQETLHQFLQDPVAAILPGLQEHFDKVREEVNQVRAEIARQQTEQFAQQYLSQNAPQLFQFDQQGQLLRDPATGQAAPSLYGQAFMYYSQEAKRAGMPDQFIVDHAEAKAQRYVLSQQQQTAQQQPGETANDKHKKAFVAGGAKRIPNRGGTEVVADESDTIPQNGSQDLRAMLMQGARKLGMIPEHEAI